jgi:hypothetical protein
VGKGVQALLAAPDVGAPMHLHHLQEEAMTVVGGQAWASVCR